MISSSRDHATSDVAQDGAGVRCSGHRMALGAYFMEGRRVWTPCPGKPAFRVLVNPPKSGDDGTRLLCSLCNGNDYVGFQRECLLPAEPAGSGEAIAPVQLRAEPLPSNNQGKADD